MQVAIVFYFCFNEAISKPNICGIVLTIPCAIFLSMDPKAEISIDGTLT